MKNPYIVSESLRFEEDRSVGVIKNVTTMAIVGLKAEHPSALHADRDTSMYDPITRSTVVKLVLVTLYVLVMTGNTTSVVPLKSGRSPALSI